MTDFGKKGPHFSLGMWPKFGSKIRGAKTLPPLSLTPFTPSLSFLSLPTSLSLHLLPSLPPPLPPLYLTLIPSLPLSLPPLPISLSPTLPLSPLPPHLPCPGRYTMRSISSHYRGR